MKYDKFKTVEAYKLKEGDCISWLSGYFDRVEAVEETKQGDILIRSGNNTSTMIFNSNELVRILIK